MTDPDPAPPPNQTYNLLENSPHTLLWGWIQGSRRKTVLSCTGDGGATAQPQKKLLCFPQGWGFHLGRSRGFLQVSSLFRGELP